ncbi:PAS-domain containing protein [Roseomonas sp. GCM10028921]
MIPFPIPPMEEERLAALRRFHLEITGREPEFDRIAQQAADWFEVPIALVTLVLQDEQRFMGACGLHFSGSPRDFAFCAHALSREEVLVVRDAQADPRFARNPLVTGDPYIRFYAGAPLTLAPGITAGTLCVIGREPRDFSKRDRRRLAAMAEIVVDMVRHRVGTLSARAAEEQVQASYRQLDEILDALPSALTVYDQQGLLVRTNRMFREIFHPDEPGLIHAGMSPADVWAELKRRGHRALEGDADPAWLQCGSKPSRRERPDFEIRLTSGGIMRGREVRTESGLLISAKTDITDLKRREATIEAQEALLRATLEAIDHGVLVVDDSLQVAFFNERYFEIMHTPPCLRKLGVPVEAHIRAWVRDEESTDAAPEILVQSRLASMRRHESQSLELATRDQRHILSVRNAMPDGRFLLMVTDITARQQADRMKDEFVAAVSHELRTPLTSIAGSLGLLAAGAGGALNDKGQRLLSIAQQNSGRLTRLINDLLDVGKIEAGRLEFTFSSVALDEALRQAAEENRPYAEGYGVSLELLLPEEHSRKLVVSADPHRLQQVFGNLLSNAAKFSPHGSRVTLALRRGPGDMARIVVTDQGPGVPEAFHGRIFQKFAQADSTSQRQQNGTGLGLAIARAIVERHAGRIGFEPGPGGLGTSFYVDLPLRERQEAPCILLVAGEESVERLLLVLQPTEAYAEYFGTVEAALDRLAKQPTPSGLLLDAGMLCQGGVALIEAVRKRETLSGVRLLVMAVSDLGGAILADAPDRIEGGALSLAHWIVAPGGKDRWQERLRSAVMAARPTLARGKPRILHVEDDVHLLELAEITLTETVEIVPAPDLTTAKRLLAEKGSFFDLAILDVGLPDGSGLDLLHLLRQPDGTPTQVVIYSAYEPDAETTHSVAAVLVKTKASIAELARTVQQLAGNRQGEARL